MTVIQQLTQRMRVSPKVLIVYLVIYYAWGFLMNEFGRFAEIAEFTYRWQIITCYLLYMVPISLVLRGLPWHQQYAYGVVMMGLLEFGGYALETSIAHENNLLDQVFGIRNFSLGMTLFFGAYFPLGNGLVKWVCRLLKVEEGGNAPGGS